MGFFDDKPPPPTSYDQANPNPTSTQGSSADPEFLALNSEAWKHRTAADEARKRGDTATADAEDAQYQAIVQQINDKYGPLGSRAASGQLTTRTPTAAGTDIANTKASGAQYVSNIQPAVNRINNIANQFSGQGPAAPNLASNLVTSTGGAQRSPIVGNQLADASAQTMPTNYRDPTANIAAAAAQIPGANPAGAAAGPNYAAMGAAAAGRAAPQIRETGGGAAAQQSALQAAQSFQPDTSGIAAIQNSRADTSGAAALSGFRPDQAGIERLDQYQPTNAVQGISDLQNFQSANTQRGVNALNSYANPNAAVGQLQGFQGDQRGVNALNAFAAQPEGPSAAQALLQSQSDKDVRTAIALARSARGGPAAVAAAQRQAQSEGAAIQAETRGQAAALRAQETDTFKQRQLQAINAAAQAGLSASGQNLMALQASGQLISDQNAQQLQAKVAAGQLLSQADQQKLSAYQSATQALTAQDQQILQAATASAQARAQADATRQAALANAANIKLQGSDINSRNAIAAANAQLTASGQQIQALSIQGQISSDIRNADINVLKSNLDASLQQLNLNDTQVRAFAQMDLDKSKASQQAQLDAAKLGLDAAAVQSALDLGWQQFAQSQLTADQQYTLQQDALKQGLTIQQNNQAYDSGQRNTDRALGIVGGFLAAASDERAKRHIRPASGKAVAQALRDSPGSSYEYTEPDKPGRAPGRHVTPMAQGLQKSKLFAPAVKPDKDGTLMVDGTRLVLAHHTALSHLQKEIDAIKKHRKARSGARA